MIGAQVNGDAQITLDNIKESLEGLGVDDLGLDQLDRTYLSALIKKFGGGPGSRNHSSSISEETDSLEDVVEPYVLQCGFIERTPRGRIATPLAYRHLGLQVPAHKQTDQQALF